jgi:hypothetical protein
MRKLRFAGIAFLTALIIPVYLSAQDSPKPESKKPTNPVTLKVQVTFSESEGEKKLANLPYTFFIRAAEQTPVSPPWTKVRVGSRVPVATGNDKGATQFQYIDVGTNIDARGYSLDDGRFDIYLDLERSWVEGDVPIQTDKTVNSPGDPNAGRFKEPIIRQFRTELTLTMRDGQTVQNTQASDPISGRLITTTVTINVVK